MVGTSACAGSVGQERKKQRNEKRTKQAYKMDLRVGDGRNAGSCLVLPDTEKKRKTSKTKIKQTIREKYIQRKGWSKARLKAWLVLMLPHTKQNK